MVLTLCQLQRLISLVFLPGNGTINLGGLVIVVAVVSPTVIVKTISFGLLCIHRQVCRVTRFDLRQGVFCEAEVFNDLGGNSIADGLSRHLSSKIRRDRDLELILMLDILNRRVEWLMSLAEIPLRELVVSLEAIFGVGTSCQLDVDTLS